MTLLGGKSLIPSTYFDGDDGVNKGSSVDLTIGRIIDSSGNDVPDRFVLQPGHMVLVLSRQIFRLKNDVTGHVTHKTTLTRQGIWALTVGLVDPGWDGPIGTTLLNFSSRAFVVTVDAPFLRVSFMKHDAVADDQLRTCGGIAAYVGELRALAMTHFPVTFLDHEKITQEAKSAAVAEMSKVGLLWTAVISVILAALGTFSQWFDRSVLSKDVVITASDALGAVQDDVDSLEARIRTLEAAQAPVRPERQTRERAQTTN